MEPGVFASPASRFTLNKTLGRPPLSTMNSGRNVVPQSKRERCCFCFELRCGVITITCIYIASFLLSVANMITNSLGWQMQSKEWQNYAIFCAVVGLPLCAAGLFGAIKKRQKFVYAYFVYNAVYALMSVFASIAFLAMSTNGTMSKNFVDKCMNYPGQDYESCREVSKAILGATGAYNFILAFVQLYWAYVVRRLYLQILIQNAGGFSPYMQV